MLICSSSNASREIAPEPVLPPACAWLPKPKPLLNTAPSIVKLFNLESCPENDLPLLYGLYLVMSLTVLPTVGVLLSASLPIVVAAPVALLFMIGFLVDLITTSSMLLVALAFDRTTSTVEVVPKEV